TQARAAADMTGRAPATAARPRSATGSHRPPPPRRTFSSGQRALLWAAGVLGALAIIIAILIVLNAQDRQDRQTPPPTITNTITETTPFESPAALPDGAVEESGGGREGQSGVTTPQAMASPAMPPVLPSAPAQEPYQWRSAPEQTLQ
ncbi:serine/threonine protein kinase, partial [Mycolicibacterium novocastrense]|nr:serine/threonine protein kinase [Mycolicibacterium novocastrense]